MPSHNFIDVTGFKFSRLTVLGRAPTRGGKTFWFCRCDCGRVVTASSRSMKKGLVKSCGCYKREQFKKRATKHGNWLKPGYQVWLDMIKRCTDPKCKVFSNYGGRGIKVCEDWHDFDAFLRDMGPPPKGLEIDRIDNNKGYSKDNCRWATHTENCRNKRCTRYLTFEGKSKPLTAWAEEYGIDPGTLYSRVFCAGFSVAMALQTPPRKMRSRETR